jgi:hypothetical protein
MELEACVSSLRFFTSQAHLEPLITVAALGICNLVFICLTWYSFYKNHPYFAKIIALLPYVGKNIGIHLNTREYPGAAPASLYLTETK